MKSLISAKPDTPKIVRLLLIMFFPVVAGLGLLLVWLHQYWTQQEDDELVARQSAMLEKAVTSINRDIQGVITDLLVLAKLDDLLRLALGDTQARQTVARQFMNFSAAKQVYDQVRYIDAGGQELVRIDLHSDRPVAIPDNMLQNKRGRYYFTDTLALKPQSVYISHFDLNMEQGVIEIPYKPTLRFATPIADAAGRTRGILVLNYLGDTLIGNYAHNLRNAIGDRLLLNNRGYWLIAPDPKLAWGFMFPDGRSFADRHPDVWQHMQAAETGTVIDAEGLYIFTTAYPLLDTDAHPRFHPYTRLIGPDGKYDQARFWKAAIFIPNTLLRAHSDVRKRDLIYLYAGIAALWFVISLALSRMRVAQLGTQKLANQLSAVIRQTSDMVIITDRDGVVEYVNPSFERITGYTVEQIVGHSPNMLKSGIHAPDFYRTLWDTIASGKAFQAVFTNRSRDGGIFYERKTITPIRDRQGQITHFASTGKDITDEVHALEKVTHLAYHNPLTDLPNRTLFRDRLAGATARAHRSGQLIALLFMDLDHFKDVNDRLGHTVGDRLLKAVAKRLRECVRESDTVAHVGGDEFAIILDDIQHVVQATTVAEKIIAVINRNFIIDKHTVYVGISIGIVLYPLDDTDIDDLIKDADTALYHAKETGRNRYEFFTADMSARVTERLAMEEDLRHAMIQREFVLHFQPVVDILNGETVTGSEALMRWRHPTRGQVPPGDFIPLLEESGLIIPVTRWLLDEVCRANDRIRAATGRNISIAVNISAKSFHGHSDTIEHLLTLINNGRIDPRHLVIEITESVLMENTSVAVPALARLRELGAGIAIDDFGTGYSSLAYLKRFSINIIKIDREFIRGLPGNPDDAALVTGAINIAHGLGHRVIAEGVENSDQLAYLHKAGCDEVQGFLFSRPVPFEEFISVVQNSPPHRPWPGQSSLAQNVVPIKQ